MDYTAGTLTEAAAGMSPDSAQPDSWIADRHFRGLIHLGALSASVVGNLVVLGLYLLAYCVKQNLLHHTLHKLLIVLFAGNLIGSACYVASLFVEPESMGCNFSVLGFVSGYAAEYYSSLMICGLLFSSLVLNARSPSRIGEAVLLLVPILIGIGCAVSTFSGAGKNPGDGGCFFRDPLGPQAMTILIGAAIPVVINLILVSVITLRLSRKSSRLAAEQLRVKASGAVLAPATNKTSADEMSKLSQRLVMYPILILLCGGTSIVSSIFTEIKVVAFIGEIAITFSGLVNTAAFLIFDPSAAKLAAEILDACKPHISDPLTIKLDQITLPERTGHQPPMTAADKVHAVVHESASSFDLTATAAFDPYAMRHSDRDKLLSNHTRTNSSASTLHQAQSFSHAASLASLASFPGIPPNQQTHPTLTHSRTNSEATLSPITHPLVLVPPDSPRPSFGHKRSFSEASPSGSSSLGRGGARPVSTSSASSSDWLTCSSDDEGTNGRSRRAKHAMSSPRWSTTKTLRPSASVGIINMLMDDDIYSRSAVLVPPPTAETPDDAVMTVPQRTISLGRNARSSVPSPVPVVKPPCPNMLPSDVGYEHPHLVSEPILVHDLSDPPALPRSRGGRRVVNALAPALRWVAGRGGR